MNEMEDDRDPFEQLSRQEQDEMEQFISEYNKETVKNLDVHLQRMWESFNKTFNANKPKEASNGTDSQKT